MRKYNIGIKTALAVFAVALSACSSDNDVVDNGSNNNETPVPEKTMSFSASMDAENTTRTDFNSNSTIWTENDAIKIVNRATITAPDQSGYQWYGNFSIVKHAGKAYTKEEVFTGTPIQSNGDGTDSFYAFYPADCKVGYKDGEDLAQIKGNLPNIQIAINGDYDQSMHFMTAHSNNSTFSFKNVCALLKITLTSNTSISRVKVIANPKLTWSYSQSFTNRYIAGGFRATVSTTDGAITGVADESSVGEPKSFVELRSADDGGSATAVIADGTYYMVVLPATLDNGFTLLLEKSDGSVIYQRVSSNQAAFERNKIYNLGTYDCSGTPAGMTALTDVVDLDLPSGTLWATKNIKKDGSFVASEDIYGDYFSWGYTSVTASYTDQGIKNRTLLAAYDVAYSYDSRYCMPIYAQIYELWNASYTSKTSNPKKSNSTPSPYGARFTVATGKSIWIPYGGHYYRVTTAGAQRLQEENVHGAYWSRTCNENTGAYADAYTLHMEDNSGVPKLMNPTGGSEWGDDRQTGRNIRPVATNIKIAPIYTE